MKFCILFTKYCKQKKMIYVCVVTFDGKFNDVFPSLNDAVTYIRRAFATEEPVILVRQATWKVGRHIRIYGKRM